MAQKKKKKKKIAFKRNYGYRLSQFMGWLEINQKQWDLNLNKIIIVIKPNIFILLEHLKAN